MLVRIYSENRIHLAAAEVTIIVITIVVVISSVVLVAAANCYGFSTQQVNDFEVSVHW